MTYSISLSTLIILIVFSLLASCTSIQKTKFPTTNMPSVEVRHQQVLAIQDWTISGKIAFIQGETRESASIHWQVIQSQKQQQLNLTTYLGINVLHLSSLNNQHTIIADGQTYRNDNLDKLITKLTGFQLPTKALRLWLKALPYQTTDVITYGSKNQLPITLVSNYQNKSWQIHYDNYQLIKNNFLPTKITITEGDLLIKIAIKKWTI
jgi:outer membrane lipoprotein LolB